MATNKQEDLEAIVVKRINKYLLPRKSSEVFGNNQRPITTASAVRASAARILEVNGVEVPLNILTPFLNSEKVDLKGIGQGLGWNIYWAQEMAAAEMLITAGQGGSYERYLPGRFFHYDLLSNAIATLFNNGGKGVMGKKVLEAGAGSGLSLVMLARRGAEAHGIDTSKIGILFSRYLTQHLAEVYRRDDIKDRVKVRAGNYFDTGLPDGTLDAVYNSGVAEHLDERGLDALITEMVRITTPGGYVLIAVPNESGVFYKGYRQTKDDLKKRFPEIIQIPVDRIRHNHEIADYMRKHGLTMVREDGLQVAPSVPIKAGDILPEHLSYFNSYLPPVEQMPSIEAKIAAWRGLELMTDPSFRITYGWTIYTIGRKPMPNEPKPAA